VSAIKIIAEAGVNHNGSVELAKNLVDAARHAGADFIKFQTFTADSHIAPDASCAEYQSRNIGKGQTMLEMVRQLELPFAAFAEIKEYCDAHHISFISTPYDQESVNFLATIDVPFFKIPSGELTNAPLLLHVARQGKPMIASTGMATVDEIERALGVLAFGLLSPAASNISEGAFTEALASANGRKCLRENVTLLHCVTEYPAPMEQLNLNAIATLREKFQLSVGYSDHSAGTIAPIAAAAMGAVIIEKHLTMDHELEGPDHKASLEPQEFSKMVRDIRAIEAALGDGEKVPGPAESKNIPLVRRSLFAAAAIKRGELFSDRNLIAKRPGTGVSPFDYWKLIGGAANRDYRADEMIDFDANGI
jgi:N-acetylneuraminate synthase